MRKLCRNDDIELEYVPARMTSTIQPLDIGVNRVIERSARQQWLAEQSGGKENRIPGGAAAQRLNSGLKGIKPATVTEAFDAAAQYVPAKKSHFVASKSIWWIITGQTGPISPTLSVQPMLLRLSGLADLGQLAAA